MSKAEINRRYKKSARGRRITKITQYRYAIKNDENAINKGTLYGSEDLEILTLVLRKEITISEAAVILGRNNQCIEQKLHRMRMGRKRKNDLR